MIRKIKITKTQKRRREKNKNKIICSSIENARSWPCFFHSNITYFYMLTF